MKDNLSLKTEKPQIGQEICLEISGFSHQGMGIGRISGFAVFVEGALPGEIVKTEIVKARKKYAIGKLLEIIEVSPNRVEPPCPYFQNCGGCSFQHISYKEQLSLKQQRILDSLERIGGFKNIRVEDVMPSPKEFFYRNRGRFHIAWEGDNLKLGYFEIKSHRVTDIEKCIILDEQINKILAYMQKCLPEYKEGLAFLRQVAVQSNSRGDLGIIFVASAENAVYAEISQAICREFPQIAYIALNISDYKAPGNAGKYSKKWRHLAGEKVLKENCADLDFSLSPGSFIQVNKLQTQNLYAQIKEFAALEGEETVLDIYCGIGTITLYLAPLCRRIMGVEEYAPAIKNAQKNAMENGIENAEFFAAPAEELLPLWVEQGLKPQLIVVDPPRQGCNEDVISAIAAMQPDKIIYVSCDPGTLARDLRMLRDSAYSINMITPFDMFPQTAHVETVCLLTRK